MASPNCHRLSFKRNYTKLFYYTGTLRYHASVGPKRRCCDGSDRPHGQSDSFERGKGPLARRKPFPLFSGYHVYGLASDSYKLSVRAKVDDAVQAESREKAFFYSSGMKISEDAPDQSVSTAANDSAFVCRFGLCEDVRRTKLTSNCTIHVLGFRTRSGRLRKAQNALRKTGVFVHLLAEPWT